MRYPLNRPRVKVGFGFGDPWTVPGAKPPYKRHTGEDDQATAGEGVYAPADGVVYNHTHDNTGWGNGVVMEFDSGGEGCCVWHVDHLVPDGTHVLEGQQIATVYNLQGNTHIHISFWVGAYDANLKAGALPAAVWPDRFVEPDRYLDSHPDLPHTGHPPTTEDEDLTTTKVVTWPDGHREEFRISGGQLQHIYEGAGRQWSKWANLVAPPDGAGCATFVNNDQGESHDFNPDGSLEIFVQKTTSQEWHYRNNADGSWHGWPIGD